MWPISRPNLDAGETFSTCVSKVRNTDLRTRLESIRPNVIAAAADYELNAEAHELHLVQKTEDVAGIVTKDEMVATYDGRMVKGPGRSAYDAIMLLPKHDLCPFCGFGKVSTLDHILPKTLFPTLVVTPDNLVASCKDCNKAKFTVAPANAADVVLHPYFDDVTGRQWLNAHVVEGPVAAVLFSVEEQDGWSGDLNTRIANQFELLGLGRLYSNLAAGEISGQRTNLIRIFEAAGDCAGAVREELTYQYESRRDDRLNAWQTATYKALCESEWFCETGFRRE